MIGSFGYKDALLLDFIIHQDEIAEEFCENKDKPELHCNGKCHISKELKNIDQTNSNSVKNKTEISIDFSWFLGIQLFSELKYIAQRESQPVTFFTPIHYSYKNINKLLDPPRC